MKLAELSPQVVEALLRRGDLVLKTGPFSFRIRSPIDLVAEGLWQLYGEYEIADSGSFADFPVTIASGTGLRRWVRRQAHFQFDGRGVFEPLPADQAYPLLEWAMNWCVSSHAHQYLIIHAAVIERGGSAAILPAPPGSGKSTLCAALVHSGWRLLSDELALISVTDGLIWPLCRPVSLKNASIAVIADFAAASVFSRVTHDTAKGSIVHMRALPEHVAAMGRHANARWVIFPRWEAGAAIAMTPRPRAGALVDLARNSFNFGILGHAGFRRLGQVIEASDCMDLRYSNLRSAVEAFDAMAAAT